MPNWLTVVCGAMALCGIADAETVLENETVRVRVKDSLVTSLHDKLRGREYISPEPVATVGLFHILLVREERAAGELDATEMTPRPPEREGKRAILAFDAPQAKAHVVIELGDAPGEARWTITVEPTTDEIAVGRVDFPVVQVRRPLDGDAESHHLLFPIAEGRLVPPWWGSFWRTYPSGMAAQMMGYYNPGGGCMLWTDDTAGNFKTFGYQAYGKPRIALQVQHRMPYVTGERWQAPYRVRASFFDGCWEAAADIYRRWQSEQFWCKTKLRDRQDMTPLLHRPPLCISSQLTRENIDDLPERLEGYRQRFGVPIIYRPLGWEKNGNWAGIDYFPPSIGREQFRALAERLRQDEIYICGFISGYHWTQAQDGATEELNGRLREYFQRHRGEEVCERKSDGKLFERIAEGRHLATICRGTAFGKQFLQETASHLLDLGVTVIHDDQDPGPRPDGVTGCFDRSHGHPVPCGTWSTQVMMEAFDQIKADAAKRDVENFFLTKEYDAELFNMVLHGYQNRNFHDSAIPGLVPLVQYLNHEYIPVIFGWVTAMNQSIRMLGAMLVYGQVPCIAFWGAPVEPVDVIPQNGVALLEDYFEAMNTYAKPYLLYGKMLRPAIQGIPTVVRKQSRWKGRVFDPPRVFHLPVVIQSAWEDEKGAVAVFAVNLSGEEMTVNCPAPEGERWEAAFYKGKSMVKKHDVAERAEVAWRLEPERLQAIVFTPTAAQ